MSANPRNEEATRMSGYQVTNQPWAGSGTDGNGLSWSPIWDDLIVCRTDSTWWAGWLGFVFVGMIFPIVLPFVLLVLPIRIVRKLMQINRSRRSRASASAAPSR